MSVLAALSRQPVFEQRRPAPLGLRAACELPECEELDDIARD